MLSHFNVLIFYTSLKIISEVSASFPVLPGIFPYLSHIRNQLDDDEKGFDLNEEDMHKFHIWPSGIIPYYIDDFSFDKVLRDKIRLELEFINKVTGLRFLEIPRPPEDDKSRWVFFINRKGLQGCADLAFNNFTTEGVQRVVLGYDCLSDGNLAAIVLAIVGVPPQHNAPNRDEYIKLHKENILPDKLYLFEILKDDEWIFHDMQYDTRSAGHYLPHQYTSNGAATITMLQSKRFTPRFQINSGNKLSPIDIKKIKSLYNYISRQRGSPKQVPGCEKLFQPGSNISNFEAAPSNVKPLKKPFKYSGVENTKDQSEEKKTEKNEKTSKEGNVDIASNKSNASEEENGSVAEENLKEKEKTSKEGDIDIASNKGNASEKENGSVAEENLPEIEKTSKEGGIDIASNKGNISQEENESVAKENLPKEEKTSKEGDIDIVPNKGNVSQEENGSVAEENIPEKEKTSKKEDKNVKLQNTAQNNSDIKEDTEDEKIIKDEKENKDNIDKNVSNNVINDDYESPPVKSREKFTLTHLVKKNSSVFDQSDYQTGEEAG